VFALRVKIVEEGCEAGHTILPLPFLVSPQRILSAAPHQLQSHLKQKELLLDPKGDHDLRKIFQYLPMKSD